MLFFFFLGWCVLQRWFPIFLQLQAPKKKKKKKTNVLGILIICQHCFTFNFFFKNVLSIFIHKIFPIIKILLRSNFFHDFILIYLKKKMKKKKKPPFIDFQPINNMKPFLHQKTNNNNHHTPRFFFFLLENVIILNYNKCSKLTLIQKIEESLSKRVRLFYFLDKGQFRIFIII